MTKFHFKSSWRSLFLFFPTEEFYCFGLYSISVYILFPLIWFYGYIFINWCFLLRRRRTLLRVIQNSITHVFPFVDLISSTKAQNVKSKQWTVLDKTKQERFWISGLLNPMNWLLVTICTGWLWNFFTDVYATFSSAQWNMNVN